MTIIATFLSMTLWLVLRYIDRRAIERRADVERASMQRWQSETNERLCAIERALQKTPFVNLKTPDQ